jgi:hypothetical protein
VYSWIVYTDNVIGQTHPVDKPDLANDLKSELGNFVITLIQIRWFVGNV